MKHFVTYLATLLTGAGVGFLVAKKLLERKYAMLAEEEINSVKETFEARRQELEAQAETKVSKKKAVKATEVGEILADGLKKGIEEGSSPKKQTPQE